MSVQLVVGTLEIFWMMTYGCNNLQTTGCVEWL